MIQVPGTEEDPALPIAIGVDRMLGKAALQVKGALQRARTGVGKTGVRTLTALLPAIELAKELVPRVV